MTDDTARRHITEYIGETIQAMAATRPGLTLDDVMDALTDARSDAETYFARGRDAAAETEGTPV
jgi:hypothetical protein